MTRRLILIRHAKSDYPAGVIDHDRPLNERGTRDAPAIGRWLAEHVTWSVDSLVVLVSSASRAQLTWGLAAKSLPERWSSRDERTESRIYDAPVPRLIAIIDEVSDEVSTLVLVGHNPGLEDLVDRLGVDDDNRAAAQEKFPTSAIAVLSTTESWAVATASPSSWLVTDFVVPRG